MAVHKRMHSLQTLISLPVRAITAERADQAHQEGAGNYTFQVYREELKEVEDNDLAKRDANPDNEGRTGEIEKA